MLYTAQCWDDLGDKKKYHIDLTLKGQPVWAIVVHAVLKESPGTLWRLVREVFLEEVADQLRN